MTEQERNITAFDSSGTTHIPDYVAESLARLKLPDIKPRFTPVPYVPPPYGRDQNPLILSPQYQQRQKRSRSSKPTKRTYANAIHLARHALKYPHTQLIYHVSDMVLRVESDASHHRHPNSRSVAGGLHYLVTANAPHETTV